MIRSALFMVLPSMPFGDTDIQALPTRLEIQNLVLDRNK